MYSAEEGYPACSKESNRACLLEGPLFSVSINGADDWSIKAILVDILRRVNYYEK